MDTLSAPTLDNFMQKSISWQIFKFSEVFEGIKESVARKYHFQNVLCSS